MCNLNPWTSWMAFKGKRKPRGGGLVTQNFVYLLWVFVFLCHCALSRSALCVKTDRVHLCLALSILWMCVCVWLAPPVRERGLVDHESSRGVSSMGRYTALLRALLKSYSKVSPIKHLLTHVISRNLLKAELRSSSLFLLDFIGRHHDIVIVMKCPPEYIFHLVMSCRLQAKYFAQL